MNCTRSLATVAQMVEQTIRNRQVKGSIPFGGSPEQRPSGAAFVYSLVSTRSSFLFPL